MRPGSLPKGPLDPAEFDLPPLDVLINDQSVLDADLMAKWLEDEPTTAGCGGATAYVANQLTTSGGSSSDGSKPLTDEEKLERMRAQNRAKTARYRQRQKERMEQLQTSCTRVEADLERERQLHASLRKAVAVQEALKDQRDAAVAALEAAAEPADPRPGQANSERETGQGAAPEVQGLVQQLWRLPFQERVQLCNTVFHHTPPAQAALSLHSSDAHAAAFSLDIVTKKQMALDMAAHHPALLEATLSGSLEELVEDWHHLQELGAGLLARHEAGEIDGTEAQGRFAPARMYYSLLLCMLLNSKPTVVHQLMTMTRLPGESEEEEAERWRGVALAVNLSKTQLQQLAPIYESYCSRMRQLGTKAAGVLDTLQGVKQRMAERWQAQGLSAAAQQYLAVFDGAGALTHHSTAAVLLTIDFLNCTGTFIKPLQKMRMVALSRPVYPDIAAMIREALHHHGMLPAVPLPGRCARGDDADATQPNLQAAA